MLSIPGLLHDSSSRWRSSASSMSPPEISWIASEEKEAEADDVPSVYSQLTRKLLFSSLDLRVLVPTTS
ncbi:unnamed protein product [Sphagnum balticum]